MSVAWGEELGDNGVPPWMLRDTAELPVAAGELDAAARELEAVGQGLQALLAGTARGLGWHGDAARAASEVAQASATQQATAARALSTASAVLRRVGSVLAEQFPVLDRLLAQRGEIVVATVTGRAHLRDARTGLPIMTGVTLTEVDAAIAAAVAVVAQADADATVTLQQALDALAPLTTTQAQGGWVATAAPAGAVAALRRAGLLEDPLDRALVARAAALPPGAAGADRLRALLDGIGPERAAALLEVHPELAARLLGGSPTAGLPAAAALQAGSAEADLGAALDDARPLPPAQRIDRIRAFFDGLAPEQVQRLAVLYPGVVGNLDGAPLAARARANRLVIAVALRAEREQLARLVLGEKEQGRLSRWHESVARNAVAGYVVHLDSPAGERQACADRIAYYERLLAEEVTGPPPGPAAWGRSTVGQHQIVYFDQAGDGGIAELWGSVDAHTRHVAVFVPGTSARIDGGSFAGYSEKMRLLASEDGQGTTATIAWLGADMPDAIVADATRPSYAVEAGPRLRDFVHGLAVPGSADSTVIGHSYGGAVVGMADQAGLDVTRVVHVESAGAGRTVWSLADYHEAETGRHVQHYTMTAPGDPIALARQDDLVQEFGIGHGGDPDAMPGFVRLETGRFDDVADPARRGHRISGFSAHGDVLTPGSTAWANLRAVVMGGRAVPFVPPQAGDPYDDPSFTSPATVRIS